MNRMSGIKITTFYLLQVLKLSYTYALMSLYEVSTAITVKYVSYSFQLVLHATINELIVATFAQSSLPSQCCTVRVLYCTSLATQHDATWHIVMKAPKTVFAEKKIVAEYLF